MEFESRHKLEKLLELHEGVRFEPYKDSRGIWTFGVGHNLEANPLTLKQTLVMLRYGKNALVKALFDAELDKALHDCKSFAYWPELDDVRQAALADMRYNLGATGYRSFKVMHSYLAEDRYEDAAEAMLDSHWKEQVGSRSFRLASMIRTGKWPTILEE